MSVRFHAEAKRFLFVCLCLIHGVVDMAVRLQEDGFRVRITAEAREFSLQNVYTGSGAHLASYSMGTVVLARGKLARA